MKKKERPRSTLKVKSKGKPKKKKAIEKRPEMKTKITSDQNFKNLFLDYLQQCLEFFAGDVIRNWPTPKRIIPIREEQLKERLHERFHELDIPVLLEFPDGIKKNVLFLFEEMTRPKDFSIYKFAHYSLDICELYEVEEFVSVAIFLERGSYRDKLNLGTGGKNYLTFQFEYCHLAEMDVDSYFESKNIVAQLNLLNMKFDSSRKVEIYSKAIEGLIKLEKNLDKRVKYSKYIDYYAKLTEQEIIQYQKEYLIKSEKKEEIMGLFEMKMEEGKKEFLLKLLKKRFGKVPKWAQEKLKTAKPRKLESWGLKLLDAQTLEEVLQ